MFYFLPVQFVGLYYWRKNANKERIKDDVLVTHLGFNEKLSWMIISILGIFLYGLFLRYLGGTLPFVDSTSTILSIIAMILMIKRVTEQWILWIAIDVVSIYMWAYILFQGGNGISMLIMWTAYLVNAMYGYHNWRKLEKIQNDR